MPKPTFVIAGAPKTGTTALSEYLRAHPNVYMSWPKEPHYFAEDFPNKRAMVTEAEYLALFDGATEQHMAIGEASVFYLSSDVALKKLREFCPAVKIIVMFRNPVDFLQSMHAQLVYNREEDEVDLESAWRLIDQRRAGQRIPASCREPKMLEYDELANFGAQYERLLSVFPKEQVLTIFFEDFVRDPAAAYASVLQFLGLPEYRLPEFRPVNERKVHRIGWIGNFTQHPPELPLVRPLVRFAKRALGVSELGLMDRIRNWNRKTPTKRTVDPQFRRELLNFYRTDIETLARLTQRDLAAWFA